MKLTLRLALLSSIALMFAFGLVCVVVAGIWGGATVSKKIFFIQSVPAVVALGCYLLAR
jgi:uncharacterized membrane protein